VARCTDARQAAPASEYYVVDGHHWVAMARKLGQDYFDAHVVEYQVGSAAPETDAQEPVARDIGARESADQASGVVREDSARPGPKRPE
jgi:hypothetical protein